MIETCDAPQSGGVLGARTFPGDEHLGIRHSTNTGIGAHWEGRALLTVVHDPYGHDHRWSRDGWFVHEARLLRLLEPRKHFNVRIRLRGSRIPRDSVAWIGGLRIWRTASVDEPFNEESGCVTPY